MIKYFSALILSTVLFILVNQSAYAVDKVSESSAGIVSEPTIAEQKDMRPIILEKFLSRYNSPLTEHAQVLIEQADANDIPWTLLAAISGVESTFCKAYPRGSHNCWGWNNGNYAFKDFPDAIRTISKKLKNGYFNRGLDTVYKIAPVYAPPSPQWPHKVAHFMTMIETTEVTPTPKIQIPF